MTSNELKTQLEFFATDQDLTYIRGTEVEANFKLDDVDTTKRAMIHFDQTEIQAVKSIGSLIVLLVPIQVLFLQIDPEADSDLDTLDDNIEDCENDAIKFHHFLAGNAVVTDIVDMPAFSLERLPAFKKFDAAFSGVLFNCQVPILSDQYFCPPLVGGFPYTFPYILP